jgi:hypothetical protein
MALRFHLDEHVDPAIADALRRRGIDVTTTMDAGLRTASDISHLEFARSEGRVIYTQDSDFLMLSAMGMPHEGIAYNPPDAFSIGQIIDYLVLMDGCMTPEEMRNHVEWVRG